MGKLDDLRAQVEPVNKDCLHCVLMAATESFKRAHPHHSGVNEATRSIGLYVGEVIASTAFANPHVDSDGLKSQLMALLSSSIDESYKSLLDKLRASVNKN